jgi:hypothetical protein
MGVSAPRSLPSTYLKGYTGIVSWIAFYTSRRLHQALVHRTPVAVWREGVTGALGAQAVDMTLRFDNAVKPVHQLGLHLRARARLGWDNVFIERLYPVATWKRP